MTAPDELAARQVDDQLDVTRVVASGGQAEEELDVV